MSDAEMLERLPERIRRKIEVQPSGCWEWKGARSNTGYGSVRWLGQTRNTHRLVFELVWHPVPAGEIVTHDCDNRACVNPAHLRRGSRSTNLIEAYSRSRGKLSPVAVQEIRRRYEQGESVAALAEEYGVSRSTLRRVAVGALRGSVVVPVENLAAVQRAETPSPRVEAHRLKLSAELADEIRRRYAHGGVTMEQLGQEYGVADTTICRIVNRRIWTTRQYEEAVRVGRI